MPSPRPARPTPRACLLQGEFIISPRVTFEVPVRILGGLMALGYEIGTIMQRATELYEDGRWVECQGVRAGPGGEGVV